MGKQLQARMRYEVAVILRLSSPERLVRYGEIGHPEDGGRRFHDQRPRRAPGRVPLLPVTLDDPGAPGTRLVRILSGVAARPALPQEVPTLIELDVDRLQALLLVRRKGSTDMRGLQPVLLVHEPVDAIDHVTVIHDPDDRPTTGSGVQRQQAQTGGVAFTGGRVSGGTCRR